MKMNDNQHFYSEISKDGSTSKVKVDADKVQVSVETKCPICQEHHQILGITDALDLRIKEDILILTVRALYSDKRSWKDAFKIKYCPFCGRPLNEEENNGKSGDKKSTSDD